MLSRTDSGRTISIWRRSLVAFCSTNRALRGGNDRRKTRACLGRIDPFFFLGAVIIQQGSNRSVCISDDPIFRWIALLSRPFLQRRTSLEEISTKSLFNEGKLALKWHPTSRSFGGRICMSMASPLLRVMTPNAHGVVDLASPGLSNCVREEAEVARQSTMTLSGSQRPSIGLSAKFGGCGRTLKAIPPPPPAPSRRRPPFFSWPFTGLLVISTLSLNEGSSPLCLNSAYVIHMPAILLHSPKVRACVRAHTCVIESYVP